ncbi:MAG: stage II sporulation protein P [Eubacteriales bacterium]|nr:stage II sporulation protein P [Eubacteriales bacterium]
MRRLLAVLAIVAAFMTFAPVGMAETDGDCLYSLYTDTGEYLTSRAGMMYVGDEYIAGNDNFYRVVAVDHMSATATARLVGTSEPDQQALAVFRAQAEEKSGGNRLICMYSTHSDECYVPNDGTSSKLEGAGIYDVGRALKENLEKQGVDVVYSEETFHPHDAGAYNRSRSTAEELLKKQPDALFDIHRDAIPAEQYETTVDGEQSSQVRLFVGRSNPNADSNKAFAQEIKKVADEKYPDLIKDIYIGKGNYNQELYGQALLLEMGTHEIDKDLAITSTEYLSDVITTTLYGPSANAAETKTEKGGAVAKGVIWAIGLAILGAILYALASTGKFSGMWNKLKRGTSEITGGAIGKGPDGKEK